MVKDFNCSLYSNTRVGLPKTIYHTSLYVVLCDMFVFPGRNICVDAQVMRHAPMCNVAGSYK